MYTLTLKKVKGWYKKQDLKIQYFTHSHGLTERADP